MLDYSRFESESLARNEEDIEMQALSQALAQVRVEPLALWTKCSSRGRTPV